MCASGLVTALGISDKLKLYYAQPLNFVINEYFLIVLEYTILLTCPQFLLNLYFSMILHKVNFKNKLLLSVLSFQTREIKVFWLIQPFKNLGFYLFWEAVWQIVHPLKFPIINNEVIIDISWWYNTEFWNCKDNL